MAFTFVTFHLGNEDEIIPTEGATSLFDAVAQALRQTSCLHWQSEAADIVTVRREDKEYRVSRDEVRVWDYDRWKRQIAIPK